MAQSPPSLVRALVESFRAIFSRATGFGHDARRWLRRHFWLAGAGVALSLFVVDVLGHLVYRVRHGAFLWADRRATQVFRVRRFTRVVDDERVVVPRKSFTFEYVQTDANGFRVGLNSYQGKATNVVFIGDSVPFGWSAEASETVPSQFSRLLEESGKSTIGVINAAVPSYTLYQSVKHYEHEVDGRFPVSAVVLQTWDPAQQLAKYGRAWTRDMNWTTRDARLTRLDRALLSHEDWIRYSSLLYYGFQARLFSSPAKLRPDDAETKSFFTQENLRTLDELGRRLQAHGIALYLLPANPTRGIPDERTPVVTALRWLNESLRAFAGQAPRTRFIDIVRRFDEVGRDGLFVDDCCHLTTEGAALEAKTIYDAMIRNDDLP